MLSIFEQFNNFLFDVSTGIFSKCKGLRPTPTGEITKNIFAVNTGSVSFYLYRKGNVIITIDSGFGESVIKRELSKLNLSPNGICAIFLTHSDFDHAGGLSVFESADIYLSADEEAMILHKTPRKYGSFYNKKISRPYKLLHHGDELSIGEIKIHAIETPGHTPGSMAYLIDDKYLFVGDAFKLIGGKVLPTDKWLSMDRQKQIESIKKMTTVKGVCMTFTAHGECTDQFDKAISAYIYGASEDFHV